MKLYILENPYLPFEYSFDSLERAVKAARYFEEENNLICKITTKQLGEQS